MLGSWSGRGCEAWALVMSRSCCWVGYLASSQAHQDHTSLGVDWGSLVLMVGDLCGERVEGGSWSLGWGEVTLVLHPYLILASVFQEGCPLSFPHLLPPS